jgi:GntR family carbon starvation induced transcriptional regulator
MNSQVSQHTDGAQRPHETQTRAGLAFDRIRNDIIRGRLVPNMRLRLEDLRERYDMGFSPLREALTRLQSEGLVVLQQMKGFRVSPVSPDHLHDTTRVRVEIEQMGLKWAIEKGDVDWEAGIISTFHKLSKQSKSVPGNPAAINEEWHQLHRAFHGALISACGSPVLMSICDALFDQAQRYVAVSIRYLADRRDDVGEHREIMEAVLDRNAERACLLNSEHIRRTTAKVVASSEHFGAPLSPVREETQ